MDVKGEGERAEIGRLRYIKMSFYYYISLMRNEFITDIVVNPLPKDTKFVRGGYDLLGNLYMTIESSEFDMLYEGDEVPYFGDLMFKKANKVN